MPRRLLLIAVVAGSFQPVVTRARAGALYNATPLTATNDNQPTVVGMDDSGRVVFWNWRAPAGDPQYSMYNPQGGTIAALVGSDVESQRTQFTPQHVSGNGQMVGYMGGKPVLSSGGQTTELPSWGQAVNDRGQVVVVRDWTVNGTTSAVWSQGMETPLGLVPGYDSTWATAINNAGQVAGIANQNLHGGGTYLSQPVVFDGQRLIPLGTFGGPNGYAVGINNQGDVIGSATNAANRSIGFVSHNGGPLVPLNVPGNDVAEARPASINDRGQIVGHVYNAPAAAFLYQNGVYTDLNSLLSPSAHLKVFDAFFINNAGQIVAEGYRDGVRWPQLFLLTPDDQTLPPAPDPLIQMVPEPGSLAVFGFLAAGLCVVRRRRGLRSVATGVVPC